MLHSVRGVVYQGDVGPSRGEFHMHLPTSAELGWTECLPGLPWERPEKTGSIWDLFFPPLGVGKKIKALRTCYSQSYLFRETQFVTEGPIQEV